MKFNSKELVSFSHPTLLQMDNIIISIKPVIDLKHSIDDNMTFSSEKRHHWFP